MVAAVLLAVGVAGAARWPGRALGAVPALVGAVVVLAVGLAPRGAAGDALERLVEPLAFVLVAAVLAAALESAGVFDAAATLLDGVRRLTAWTWVLSAAVVAVLNLDAAVLLLTPLYVRLARRRSVDPVALAFQLPLVACLASTALPVSNLTNLVALESWEVGTARFLRLLGPPTLAALLAGYAGWRLAFRGRALAAAPAETTPVDRRALRLGAAVLALLVAGFVAGRDVGIPPWAVAAAALAVALATGPRRAVPWRAAPLPVVGVAAGLAVLAVAVGRHVDVAALLDGGPVRVVAVGAVAADVLNNLPALLVLLPGVGAEDTLLAALLVGVGIGPTAVVTGSLSTLLWLRSARDEGVAVGALDVARVGLLVGLPALAAATAALVLV